jgi:hypothetical protein
MRETVYTIDGSVVTTDEIEAYAASKSGLRVSAEVR